MRSQGATCSSRAPGCEIEEVGAEDNGEGPALVQEACEIEVDGFVEVDMPRLAVPPLLPAAPSQSLGRSRGAGRG